MAELTYTGIPTLIVNGVGEWPPGESKAVDDPDLAGQLLKRPDFIKTQPKKTVKATPAKAKTTA